MSILVHDIRHLEKVILIPIVILNTINIPPRRI